MRQLMNLLARTELYTGSGFSVSSLAVHNCPQAGHSTFTAAITSSPSGSLNPSPRQAKRVVIESEHAQQAKVNFSFSSIR
jgi:hypothetical protein